MRIKLSLLAPFREAKILLAVPDDVQTIAQLKKHLIRGLSAIGSVVQHSKELVLEIEGFELLAGSEIGIIVPQDVVCARAAAGSSTPLPSAAPNVTAGVKRKLQLRASTGDLRTSLGKKTKTTPRRAVSSANPVPRPVVAASAPLQSSSDGSSSESESSSETESSSEDESDSSLSSSESSSSASSSSSSSVSSPEELPARRKQLAPDTFPPIPPGLLPRPTPTDTHVPPGQGKVSTQNRNARRRRARLLKKLGEEVSGVDTSSAFENDQIETRQEEEMPLQHGVPMQIANNNKRKGFLKDMVKLRATKTVFETDESDVAMVATDVSRIQDEAETTYGAAADISMVSAVSATPGGSKRRPHIVHPSAQTLPSNVFVTSAQFQHPPRPKARKRTAAPVEEAFFAGDVSEEILNGDYGELNKTTEVNGEGQEGGVDEEAAMNEIREVDEWAMWEKAETAFDTLPSLSSVSDERLAQSGALVVWKELELDMTTFSPELRVQLARPKAAANTAEGGTPVLRLENLRRPLEEAEGDEAGATGETEAEDVVLTGEDLQREPGKWKILIV